MSQVIDASAKHGIYLYQGAALSSMASFNEAELECYRKLSSTGSNIVAGIIGNETLLRKDLSEDALIGYIGRAKAMSKLPMSTAETWDQWCHLGSLPRCPGRARLGGAVDFIAAHVYPYWEGIAIEHAAAHVVATYINLRAIYPGKKVVITETGWPTCGAAITGAVPEKANQRRFYAELWRWSKQLDIPVIWFEAFDEPWKAWAEGKVGACWGLYDVGRKPKYPRLEESTFEQAPPPAPPNVPAVRIDHPRGGTKTQTKFNCSIPLFGRVYHAKIGWRIRIEVLTDAWYVQDSWYPTRLVPVVDGMWSLPEVVLAGQGARNNHGIRATLVDEAGLAIASDEVLGIVRSNACVP